MDWMSDIRAQRASGINISLLLILCKGGSFIQSPSQIISEGGREAPLCTQGYGGVGDDTIGLHSL